MEVEDMETGTDTAKVGISTDNLRKRTSVSSEDADESNANVTPNEEYDEVFTNSKRLRTIQSSPSVADEAGSESPVVPERLEVPSKELQCIQKQVLIEKLMATSPSYEEAEELMDAQCVATKEGGHPMANKNLYKKPFHAPRRPPAKTPEDLRQTFKIRSSILDRVKTFLPELKNANDELLRLPDASKISLESDSDEMDGAVPGPSGLSLSSKAKPNIGKIINQRYVEMNLALVEQSDSDSSTDDEREENQPILNGSVKGLPVINATNASKRLVSSNFSPESQVGETASLECRENMETVKDSCGEKNSLISELN